MKIRIFWVGRTKERYLIEGINHYLKLLRYMGQVSIIEIKDEKGKIRDEALSMEGRRVLKQTNSYILLDERGKEFSSIDFARYLNDKGSIDFVMGGAFGVSDEVREKASDTIALSKMTLTHEMTRLVFLEQLYRAMTIIKGKNYHY
jgi:23S rRNA (pseudouridine1915-N3)-methyltransferase